MRRLLLFFLCLMFIGPLYASDTLVLKENDPSYNPINKRYLEIFEDSSRSLTIRDILNPEKAVLFSEAEYSFNKNTKSAYWIKITARNESAPSVRYLLESYFLYTNELSIYYEVDGKIYQQHTGELTTYSHRDYHHKNLLLDFPLPEDHSARTFYIRVYSVLYSDFNFLAKNQHSFTNYTVSEYWLLGIYYGILLIMAIYNLILFFTIRSRVYLLYIFYVLAGILVSLNEDKLGYQYLWPEHPSWNPMLAYHVAPLLLLFSFILYSTEFLELRKRNVKLFLAAWGSFFIYIIVFIINFYYSLEGTLRLLTVISFLLIFISAIIVYSKGYKPVRFFIAANFLILFSIVLIQMRSQGYIQGSIFTVYIFNYSLVTETIILSISLSDKIKIIQKEKDQAKLIVIAELEENKRLQDELNIQLKEKHSLQEKVNRELETKVSERTAELRMKTDELEVSNSKLQSLIEQANKMNIKLDLDNWELKKNVQQELVQRITGQEVSFEVFQTLFKDEFTCLKFLDEIKWAKGYVCRKCGYNKCKETDNSFLRKCSRCSYPESITSGTILHGIKFQINKALYLIYLIHKRKGKIKLEEISEVAGISIVSASKFKAKVMEKITELEKENKYVIWEEIIF
ncbi:MAG: 7TM diverse intracellular signaling domain-containing protein [Cytophagaceae bacterium]